MCDEDDEVDDIHEFPGVTLNKRPKHSEWRRSRKGNLYWRGEWIWTVVYKKDGGFMYMVKDTEGEVDPEYATETYIDKVTARLEASEAVRFFGVEKP